MGAVISLLWSYVVSSYVWMFPQNVPITTQTTSSSSSQNRTGHNVPLKTNTAKEIMIGKVDDFQDGEMKECGVDGEKLLIIREGNTFNAMGAKCSHAKQSLKNGAYMKGRVRCSLHGACYSVATGDIEDYPSCDSIPVFPIRVENNQVLVKVDKDLLKASQVTKPMRKRVTSDSRVIVIVGGGPAGATAAETLRSEGYTGRLIVINREKNLPYDRTKLSKVMSINIDKCLLRNAEFYEKYDIEYLLGTEVVELDADNKLITLSDKKTIQYDKALIATGADCQRLPFIKGYDAPNVHVVRTIEDSHRIWNSCEGKNVLIVGSSFIGMEVASCIVDKCKVTVIGMEKVPFERVLGPEVGKIMQAFHESKGVKFIMEATTSEFKTTNGEVTSVLLKNGEEIAGVDVVIIGAGVIPTTNYLKSSKLQIGRDKSVIVDKYLWTGIDGLWAAGDLARFPYTPLSNELVRIEHWGMAQLQGSIAAKNMLAEGPQVKCENIPFFWTAQYGRSVRYCGHALTFDEVIIDKLEGDVTNNKFGFVAYYIHKGQVLAVSSLNRDPIVAEVAELLHHSITVSAEELNHAIKLDGDADRLIKSKLNPKNQ